MRVAAAWVAIIFLLLAVQYLLWHWPVRKRMAIEDKLVRGGLLVVIFAMVAAGGYVLLAVPALPGPVWWGLIVVGVAGTGAVVGFTVLLWKFRYHRDTAAITTSVGELGRPERPNNGDY